MKWRLLIPILLAFSFMASKCEQNDPTTILCQKWEFVSSLDPYQGGTIGTADPDNKQYRIFEVNGNYEEYDNDNSGVGRWAFNADSTHLGTVFEKYNGEPTGQSLEITDFRWKILELTADKLVLSIQGRHGFVEHEYKSTKR
jgi:hypothetical protein